MSNKEKLQQAEAKLTVNTTVQDTSKQIEEEGIKAPLQNEVITGTLGVTMSGVKFHNHKFQPLYYLTIVSEHGTVELNVGEKTYNTIKGILERAGSEVRATAVNSSL